MGADVDDIVIRPMEEEDVPSAAALEEAIFSMPWSADAFLEMVRDPKATYMVAVLGASGKICGICGLLDMAGDGFITNVAVSDKMRRRGIAKRLVAAVIEAGRMNGISAFTLEVRVSNRAAIGLYEGFGFKNVGIRPGFYEKPREDAYIYWLRDDVSDDSPQLHPAI